MSPLAALEASLLDDRIKGIPGGVAPFPLGTIGAKGWNLLRQDLPLPVALLKASALEHNSRWMRDFLARTGSRIAPHGKTTMSPQLFHRQLADGAWAITLATMQQVQVARRYGIGRILLANQLVDPPSIRWLLQELRRDRDFEFYALVDSVEGVEILAAATAERPLGRPLPLLLEAGYAGGRTGCRSVEAALGVARAVQAAAPRLALRGVEGFEGLIEGPGAEAEQRVEAFLGFLLEVARAVAAEDLFAPGPAILSAGGSQYYDMVAASFAASGLGRETLPVLRSGCYLTHDSGTYRRHFARLVERSTDARALGEGPKPALELWAHVQSRPEAQRAILTLGKRDASYDAGLPVPFAWFRPGVDRQPRALPEGHRAVAMNDQHTHIVLPADSPLRVGDMVGLGISHPCLTFDKWQVMPVVDDDYGVIAAIRTFF